MNAVLCGEIIVPMSADGSITKLIIPQSLVLALGLVQSGEVV